MTALTADGGPALCWCGRPARHHGRHKGAQQPKPKESDVSSRNIGAAPKPARASALPGRSAKMRALVEREIAACHVAITRLKDEIRTRQAELLDVEAALAPLVNLLDTYRVLALPAPERVVPAPAVAAAKPPSMRAEVSASKSPLLAVAPPRATEAGTDGAVEEDFAPEEVGFDRVKRWATVRSLPFASWDDLPAINAHREKFELPPFKRGFARLR